MKSVKYMLSVVTVIGIILSGCGSDAARSDNTNTVSTGPEESFSGSERRENSTAKSTASSTARWIIQAYQTNQFDNYHQEISYSTKTVMESEKDPKSIPSTVSIITDRAGNYMHEVQTTEMKGTDLASEYVNESYIVKKDDSYELYTSLQGSNAWYHSTIDNAADAREIQLDPDDFDRADVQYSSKEKTFTVSEPIEDLSDTNDIFVNALKKNYQGKEADSTDELKKILEESDSNAVFTFSADDMTLLYVSYDPVTCTVTAENTDQDSTISVTSSMTIEVSSYDQINKADVKVPNKIVKSTKKAEQTK